jgi:hypothetical protein
MGWATADEIDDFRSVHSEEDFGDKARHAEQFRARPLNPMDGATARQFIGRLIDRWLAQK